MKEVDEVGKENEARIIAQALFSKGFRTHIHGFSGGVAYTYDGYILECSHDFLIIDDIKSKEKNPLRTPPIVFFHELRYKESNIAQSTRIG